MKFATIFEYGNHEKIAENRPLHREYLSGLKAEGKLAASGPFTDDSGALIVYEADSEAEAVQLIEGDPFRKAGVFKSYTMKPWNQVF